MELLRGVCEGTGVPNYAIHPSSRMDFNISRGRKTVIYGGKGPLSRRLCIIENSLSCSQSGSVRVGYFGCSIHSGGEGSSTSGYYGRNGWVNGLP
jgi:hypothetical protein